MYEAPSPAARPTRPAIVAFPVLRARLRPVHRADEQAPVLSLRLLSRAPFADPRRPRPAA